MLKLIKITKLFKEDRLNSISALKDINVTFPERGLVSILGMSGSGKTTLLNILSGLLSPTSGEYYIDNCSTKNLNEIEWTLLREKYFSYLFQNNNLIENLTVDENMRAILDFKWQSEEYINLLEKLEILSFKNTKVNQLSGGEKQRVAIARSILKDFKVFLADEPTSSLDEENTTKIFEILKAISKDKLVITVTHDEEFARKYSDYILELDYGEIIGNTLEYAENIETQLDTNVFEDHTKMSFKNILSILNLLSKKFMLKSIFFILFISIFIFAFSLNFHINPISKNELIYELYHKTDYEVYIPNTIEKEKYANLRFKKISKDANIERKTSVFFNTNFLFFKNHEYSIFSTMEENPELNDQEVILTDYQLNMIKFLNFYCPGIYDERTKTIYTKFYSYKIVDVVETAYQNFLPFGYDIPEDFDKVQANAKTLNTFLNHLSYSMDVKNYRGYIQRDSDVRNSYYNNKAHLGNLDIKQGEVIVTTEFIKNNLHALEIYPFESYEALIGRKITLEFQVYDRLIASKEYVIGAICATLDEKYDTYDYNEANSEILTFGNRIWLESYDYQMIYNVFKENNYFPNDFSKNFNGYSVELNHYQESIDLLNLLDNTEYLSISGILSNYVARNLMKLQNSSMIFLLVGIFSVVLYLLLFVLKNVNFMKNNLNKIRILRSLGIQNKWIIRSILFKYIYQLFFVILFVSLSLIVFCILFNNNFAGKEEIYFNFIILDFFAFLKWILVVLFIFTLLAIINISKIKKLKMID